MTNAKPLSSPARQSGSDGTAQACGRVTCNGTVRHFAATGRCCHSGIKRQEGPDGQARPYT